MYYGEKERERIMGLTDLNITKGKYNLNRVSGNPIYKSSIVKENKKNAEKYEAMFNKFDRDGNGYLNTSEQVELTKFFKTFDSDGNGKLSKDEFNAYEDGKVIRKFFKKIMKTMNKSEAIPVEEVEANNKKPQAALAADVGPVVEITDEEYEAAVKKQNDTTTNNDLHKYVVQMDESLTNVLKKSLAAQGITDPTPEQLKEAKEQFKQDNPNAVKTNKKGYEFLLVGAEVKLRGEVAYEKDSKGAIADWCEKYPHLVLHPQGKPSADAPVTEEPAADASTTESPAAEAPEAPAVEQKTPEERAKEAEENLKSIQPDLTPEHKIDENLQSNARTINETKDKAKTHKEALDELLTHDWLGAPNVSKELERIDENMVAYVADETIADRIDNVFGLDKDDVKTGILDKLKSKAEKCGLLTDDEKAALDKDMSLEEMQGWINSLKERIIADDAATLQAAADNKAEVEKEQKALKELNDNKALIDESLQSVVRTVDMAQNEPDNVEREIVELDNKETKENIKIKADGTTITIIRDAEGNITSIMITNPNGPDQNVDIMFKKDSVWVDPDKTLKGTQNSDEKEINTLNFINFENLKALIEKISQKPEAAETEATEEVAEEVAEETAEEVAEEAAEEVAEEAAEEVAEETAEEAAEEAGDKDKEELKQ